MPPKTDDLEDDLDAIFDAVEAWYDENLSSCAKSQYRLDRQVDRISVISDCSLTTAH